MYLKAFWQYEPKAIMDALQTSDSGLSTTEATKRIAAGTDKKKEKHPLVLDMLLLISQFKSPLTL